MMTKTTIIRFLNSLNKLPVYKKDLRLKSKLPVYLNDVLIGLLLSDGHLERSSPTSAVRLSVSFSVKHADYLKFLYDLFEPYTNTKPMTIKVFNKKTDTFNEVIKFKTTSLPQLLDYHRLFYQMNSNGKLVKIVPVNIVELMSPVVLAHLIMGDGNIKLPDKIIRIYTNSFTKIEVELLASAITKKLNILTKVAHDRNDQYMITISKSQLSLVTQELKSHIHPSMSYKLALDPESLGLFNSENLPGLRQFSSDCCDYKDILDSFE